jgi:hypothetical protein
MKMNCRPTTNHREKIDDDVWICAILIFSFYAWASYASVRGVCQRHRFVFPHHVWLGRTNWDSEEVTSEEGLEQPQMNRRIRTGSLVQVWNFPEAEVLDH